MLNELIQIWGYMTVMAFITMLANMVIRRKFHWDLKMGAFFSITVWIPHLVMVFFRGAS